MHASLFELLAKMSMDNFDITSFVMLSVADIVAMLIDCWLFTYKEIKE